MSGRLVLVFAAAIAAMLSLHCGRHGPTVAGFWFDRVTFELPARETDRIGGAIGDEDKRRIEDVARAELTRAYSGLRITFADDRDAFYRVRVVQDIPELPRGARSNIAGSAGDSIALGPFPAQGAVSFVVLATNAIYFAPAGAERQAILDAIGRGIGRTAAHEFAHQIVRDAGVDGSDPDSYEYGSADRASQYYGTLHWSGARERIAKKLGP